MNSDCSYKSILAIPFFRVLFQFPANIEIKWTKNLWIKSKCPKPFCRKVVNNDGKMPKVGYLLFWRARITLSCRTLLCIAVHSRSSLHWSATFAARASGKLRRSSLVGLVGGHGLGGRGDLGGPVGKQRSRHREPEMEMKHIVKETAYLWTSEYYLVNPEKLKKAHPTDSFPIIAIQDFEQLIPSQCSMIPDIQP